MDSSLDRLNCEAVRRALARVLDERFQCHVEGIHLVVSTPLLYGDGDSVRVYLDLTTLLTDVQISDLGDALGRARSYGQDLGPERVLALLAPLRLRAVGRAIATRFPLDQIGLGIMRVAQGAVMLEAAATERAVSTRSRVFRSVDDFVRERRVKARRNFYYTVSLPGKKGKHDVTRRVDFLIDDRFFIMTIPSNNQRSRQVEHAFTFWTLLDRAQEKSFGRISVIDDQLEGQDADLALLGDVSTVLTVRDLKQTGGDAGALAALTGQPEITPFYDSLR